MLPAHFDKLTCIEKIANNLYHLKGEIKLIDEEGKDCGILIMDIPCASFNGNNLLLYASDYKTNEINNREARRKRKKK